MSTILKERISEFEGRSLEIIQTEEKGGKEFLIEC